MSSGHWLPKINSVVQPAHLSPMRGATFVLPCFKRGPVAANRTILSVYNFLDNEPTHRGGGRAIGTATAAPKRIATHENIEMRISRISKVVRDSRLMSDLVKIIRWTYLGCAKERVW